jgi:hypothetical protein
VTLEHTDFDELSDAALIETAEALAIAGEDQVHAHSLSAIETRAVNLAYGLTEDLMLAARLPFIARDNIREAHTHEEAPGVFHAEVHALGDAEGWGDLSLLAQWRFFGGETSHTHMAALLGVEAPTVESDVNDDEDEPFDAEFQPGSDSWDFFFGFAASHRKERWSFDGSALYTIAGDGLDANLGNRFNYGLAASYRALGVAAHHHREGEAGHSHGPSVDLVLELNGEWHEKQEEDGQIDPNSGGHVLFAAPGVRYKSDAFSAFASVGLPVVVDFNGVQAEPGLRPFIGVGYRF